MTGRTKMISIALAVVAVALLVGSLFVGRNHIDTVIQESVDRQVELTTQGYQQEVDRLNKAVKDKDAQIKLSEQRYAKVKDLIRVAAQRADNIKAPEDMSETKKRFSDIGFKPVR